MKKSMILIAMAALTLMVTGCKKDEDYGKPAAYGKVFCDISHPIVDDDVVFKAEVSDWGDCINSATYTWTIKKEPDGPTTTISNKVYRQSGDKSLYEVPCSDKWKPTEAGKYTISMSAEFRYTLGDVNSVMYGSASAKDGTVTIFAY